MTGVEKNENNWVDAKGWISEEEKLELLQRSSILIAPSAYEGQPLAILEALSCGLPCLASDKISELPNLVETAELQNLGQWSSKVKKILSQEINTEELISASKPFSIENIKKKWKSLYNSQFN